VKRTILTLATVLMLATPAPAPASDFKDLMCNMCTISNGNAAACTLCNIMIVWEFFDHNDAPAELEDADDAGDPDGTAGPGVTIRRLGADDPR